MMAMGILQIPNNNGHPEQRWLPMILDIIAQYSTQPSFESFMMTSWQCRMLQDGELFDFDREVEPILDVLVSCQPATEDHWDPSGKILYRTTSPLSYSLWPSIFLRWWRPWSSPSWNLPRESGRFSFFSPEYISLYHLSSISISICVYICW